MQPTQKIFDAKQWAATTFGAAHLGDRRRSRQLVQVAQQIAEAPSSSFPKQTQGHWGELKALYRLVHEEDVTPQQILAPSLSRFKPYGRDKSGAHGVFQQLQYHEIH